MSSNKVFEFFREKGVIVALVLCLISAGTITAIYQLRQNNQRTERKVVDLSELEDEAQELQEANNDKVTNTDTELEDKYEEQGERDAIDEAEHEVAETSQKPALNFQGSDKLNWPVTGNVILNYSMDKTVYFSTLDQYKYNPAIIISGEVNEKVLAAVSGEVTSIEVNEETGNTVVMDLGNGYQAVYGQLKEVPLKVGDVVETNTIIGYISEPTKYYSVEGSNLYFAVLKDDEPVNPMDFLE